MLKKSFKITNDLEINEIILFGRMKKIHRAILLPKIHWLGDRSQCSYWII